MDNCRSLWLIQNILSTCSYSLLFNRQIAVFTWVKLLNVSDSSSTNGSYPTSQGPCEDWMHFQEPGNFSLLVVFVISIVINVMSRWNIFKYTMHSWRVVNNIDCSFCRWENQPKEVQWALDSGRSIFQSQLICFLTGQPWVARFPLWASVPS